jgi:hypothetical protein
MFKSRDTELLELLSNPVTPQVFAAQLCGLHTEGALLIHFNNLAYFG